MSAKFEGKDAWSSALIAVLPVCAFVMVLLVWASPFFVLPLILVVPLVLAAALCRFCYDVYKRRFRHALSIIIAAGAIVAVVYVAVPLLRVMTQHLDTMAFQRRLPEFQQQVEEARAQRTGQKPLQIVVDEQDRSILVTTNLFYYVIYDETDGAGPYMINEWPYSRSPTGITVVDLPKNIHHLAGHFYDFSVSY